ncbi:MAG: GNAT family N-acetyltransferase [Pseudomonadota bacterium]
MRNARPGDAEALARLHREARAAAMPWLPILHTPEEDHAFFETVLSGPSQLTICEADSQPAAFIATRPGWIDHLYVAPAHWRRGYGRRLLSFTQAMQGGLQLWTFQDNTAARSFYAAHGFREAELTDGANNEERTPDVRLVWTAPASPLA